MKYEVLSPWAEVDKETYAGLQPRVSDLDGKTVGLFSHFKEHSPLILKEVERQIKKRFPTVKFSHYQYVRDTAEIVNDSQHKASFMEWLSGVDTVISGYGDAGSCTMFVAYNSAAIEKLGKPVVMLVNQTLVSVAQRGASARQVPGLRLVKSTITELSMLPSLDRAVEDIIRPGITPVIDGIILALTKPLTEEEKSNAQKEVEVTSGVVFKGNLEEVNAFFYKKGWSTGTPIIPPTEEAVNEMLKGTDLPRDYVVARIPPMLGKATVEKIAINAVMAGCLPTYLPVLIAAVEGMVDPKIHLEGWTCSVASFAPLIIVNGPIRHGLNINSGKAIMSPYYKTNATIAHAFGLMVMNIGGVRPGLEDMSAMGHEARFGMCIAEDEEGSPWEPLHTDYGFKKEDSSVTLFWSGQHLLLLGGGNNAVDMIRKMCTVDSSGFERGCAFILTPPAANMLFKEGWRKKDIISYIVEYSRQPASEVNLRWLKGNHHVPKDVLLPVDPTHSTRRYFSSEHLLVIVGGKNYAPMGLAYDGGGDHGGPAIKKVQLPKKWDELVKKYQDMVPTYVRY